MTKKKQQKEFSPFNTELVVLLASKVDGLTVDLGKLSTVPLQVEVDGQLITFATMRKSGRTKTCDVLLNGYNPEDTSLTGPQLDEVVKTSVTKTSTFYLYRTHNLERAAKALQAHFKDIKRRIRKTPSGKGSLGRPRGIPVSYFNK